MAELCDLLNTASSGRAFLKLQDALLLAVQAFSRLADAGHARAAFGAPLLAEEQLSAFRQSLQNAILKVPLTL